MDYAAVIGLSFSSTVFHGRYSLRHTIVSSLRPPNFFNPKRFSKTPLLNPPSLLLLRDRRVRPVDCLRAVGSVRGGEEEDGMEGKTIPVWFKVGGLVAVLALAMFVVRCKSVVAADGVVRDLKERVLGMRWWDPDLFKNMWPKVLLILKLFKEQGLVLFFLLGLSGFFSMSETAITTLWPWKVRELAEKEPDNGVFKILRNDVNRFLTTILIGTTVASIAATAIFTDAVTAIFGEAGITAATAVMTVAVLLLTEITPKSIGIHNATDVAKIVVRPIALLSVILYPVGKVATYLSMGIQKMLGLKARSEPYVTENELKLMLRGAELSGAIEEEEQDMIENVLMIKDTVVREVMTPLVDVVAIDANVKLIDFQKLWVTKQYSRVPVFEQRVDNIVGIAFAMDMLEYVEQVEKLDEFTVLDIVHNPTYFVPDSMSVWNLLREFRIRKVHMAVVLNEYGGTIGIVTLEDVVEEIVGEIFDENDSKEEIHRKTGFVVMLQDGSFLVDANTSMDQLSEELNIELPEDHQYETVSGFICESFGCIPNKGSKMKVRLEKSIEEENDDDVEFHHQNNKEREKHQIFEIEILEANARRVESVVFKPINDGDVSVELTGRDEKRLVSTKVVKRRKKHNSDMDYNPNTIDEFEEPLSIKNSEIGDTVLQETLNYGVIKDEEQSSDQLPNSNQQ